MDVIAVARAIATRLRGRRGETELQWARRTNPQLFIPEPFWTDGT